MRNIAGDMEMSTLRNYAIVLVTIANLSKIPVIATASVPQGPNGPWIPEILVNVLHAHYVARKGEINTWDISDFVAAMKRRVARP